MESKDAVRLTDRLHAEQGKGDPFAAAVRATRMPMLITDPRQDDNPIVFANDAFMTLTGYGRDEVMGRNCRFLQGRDTDPAAIALLREAIDDLTDATVELLNYKKDGTPFWNALYISPVFGEQDDLQFFFASQFDVTERKMRELEAQEGKGVLEVAVTERTVELRQALEQKTLLLHEVDHRVKNNLQMVAGMLRNQARFADGDTRLALDTAVRRVETLGAVHQSIYQSNDVRHVDASEIANGIAGSIVGASGRTELRLELNLAPLMVPSAVASPLALLINELLTNAVKHAFPENRTGTLKVSLGVVDGQNQLIVEDDGVGMGGGAIGGRRTFGSRLITSLVQQLDAQMTTDDTAPGTRVVVRFPTGSGPAA